MAEEDVKSGNRLKGAEAAASGKAATEMKKAGVEAPKVGEELLSLLEYVSEIDRSSALRELKVDGKTLDAWVDELSKDDWIWVVDREIGEYYMGLTDNSRERINQLKELKKQEESMVEEKPAGKKAGGVMARLTVLVKAFARVPSFITSNFMDFLITAGIVTLAYLLYRFFKDPNQLIMNFIVGMVLLSQILFTYRGSGKKLKTKRLMDTLMGFKKILSRNWRGIIFSTLVLFLIYFIGWAVIFPPYRTLSILACTIIITSIIQMYYPLKPASKAPRFYAGTMLLVYSLLLITGMTKITPLIASYENRVVDVAVGIAIMAVVYIKRDFFGVQPSYFSGILSQEEE